MHKLSSRSVFQVKFILLEGDKTRNIPKKLSKTSKEKHLNDYRLIALARNFVWVKIELNDERTLWNKYQPTSRFKYWK